MAIQFTPTQANIQTGATQYNVQPNLTAARAFQGIEQGIMSGMKLQEQIKEEDFRKRQTDLQNTMAAFNEDYAKASWSQKQVMANELEALVVTPYGEDNRWDRALNSAGTDFKSRVVANLEAEREQRARAAQAAAERRRRTEIDLAYLGLQQQLQDTTDIGEQATIVAQWKTDNVDAYEGTDPEAYARALGHYVNARGFVVEQRRSLADNQIRTDVFASVQATVAATGGITVEEYQGLQADLSNLSDYEENKAAYNSALADATLSTLRAQYNSPDRVATQGDVDLLVTQLKDLVEADPFIMQSPAYRETQNMVSNMQSAVNTGELNTLNAMLYDGTVSQAVFDAKVDTLAENNLLTEEQASQQKYQKSTLRAENTQHETILPLIATGDVAGLRAGVDSGELNRTTVTTAVKDALTAQHADLIQSGENPAAVNSYILNQLSQYQEAGIAPTSIPVIDQTLASPRSGQLLSPEEFNNFIVTYEAAKEAGYFGIADSRVTADYLAARTMMELGVPNPQEKLYNALANPVRVTDSDLNSTLNKAIQDGVGVFVEGLDPRNAELVRTHMRPIVRTLLRADVDASDVIDLVQTGMEASYLRVDPSFGTGNTVWIPKTEEVATEQQYLNVRTAINNEMQKEGRSLAYVGPMDLQGVTTNWVALDDQGNPLYFPYEVIATAARTERIPQQ